MRKTFRKLYVCVKRPTYVLVFVLVESICICAPFFICVSVIVSVAVCILRVEGWRKSPLLMCWKLAQASIADFSRPQNWIYWLTLSGEF